MLFAFTLQGEWFERGSISAVHTPKMHSFDGGKTPRREIWTSDVISEEDSQQNLYLN